MAIESSVVLVVGRGPGSFGTGFVIHHDETSTYVLTCAHVVEGVEIPRAGNRPAIVVVSDSAKHGFDLAVLKTDGKLDCSPLDLSATAKPGRPFMAKGFSDKGGSYVLQTIRGNVGKPAGLWSETFGNCGGWQLDIATDGRFEDGLSGSPVVDETTGRVLGVVAIRADENGKRGIAIAVAALRQIWPSMPASVRNALNPSSPVASTEPKDPVMNLKEEVIAFRAVLATQQSARNPSIVIDGGSGMGKSYLLELYEMIAQAEGFQIHKFSLKAQLSVLDCLSEIISRFGAEHFQHYDKYLISTSQPADQATTRYWQMALTRCFFRDLEDHSYMDKLVVFFDQYEKADEVFTAWLQRNFLPLITPRIPLIAVVAGQGADRLRDSCHFLSLNGFEKEHFYRYAQECNVDIPAKMIDAIHYACKGRPKDFADFVYYFSRSTAGIPDDRRNH